MFEQISNGLLIELLSQMGRYHEELETGINRLKDVNLQKIIENMHSSYNLQWTVKVFARECNLSVYRFIHNFKAYTGMSPMEYLKKIRIDKARELVLDSSLNINEISNVLGMKTPSILAVFSGVPPDYLPVISEGTIPFNHKLFYSRT